MSKSKLFADLDWPSTAAQKILAGPVREQRRQALLLPWCAQGMALAWRVAPSLEFAFDRAQELNFVSRLAILCQQPPDLDCLVLSMIGGMWAVLWHGVGNEWLRKIRFA